MKFSIIATSIALAGITTATQSFSVSTVPSYNVIALTVEDGEQAFQCWSLQLDALMTAASGDQLLSHDFGSNFSFRQTIFPPQWQAPLASSPFASVLSVLSGKLHLNIAGISEEVWVLGGSNGMILVDETAGRTSQNVSLSNPGSSSTLSTAVVVPGGLSNLAALYGH